MAGFCALCAIQNHVSRALESTGRILAPKDLVSNLRCISRSFRNARQEDAHEYMVNLLESMHKCCLPSGMPSESPTAYEKSLVHKIFGGRLRSQVKCMQCSFCSNKFDPFLDLSLEINKADSLHKALVHFTASEQLDGGERQYQCQQCKQKVRALKQLTIYKAPEVLSIHLKRFGSFRGQKIDKKIQFGPTLDLKSFVTGPYDGDLKYTLYGVLVHAGWSTHSGHYYCFVRTSSGMWYSLDDNRVYQVSEKTVLEQKAYMLFYVRDRTFSLSKKTSTLRQDSMAMSSRNASSMFSQGLKASTTNGIMVNKLKDTLSAEVAKKQAPNPLMVTKELQLKMDPHPGSNCPTAQVSSHLNSNGSTAQVGSHLKSNGSTAQIGSHLSSQTNSCQDSNGPTPKVDSHQNGNLLTSPTCSFSCKEQHTENLLKVSATVGLEKGLSISKLKVDEPSLQTVLSLKGSGSVEFSNSANKSSCTSNGLTVPITVQHDCDGLCYSPSKNENASVTPSNADNLKADPMGDPCSVTDRPSNLNVQHASPRDASHPTDNDVEKVGGFSKSTGTADPSVRKADDSVENKSCLSKTHNGLVRGKSLYNKLSAVKLKPLKRCLPARKMSKSIIFGAAFGRRKKLDRRERYTLMKLDGDSLQTELRSLTSEKSAGSSLKRLKCGSHEKDKILGKRKLTDNGDKLKGSKDVNRDNIGQCCKSLATSTDVGMTSSVTLGVKSVDAVKSGDSKCNKRESEENGFISKLTRDIQETTVARWDDVEHPSSCVEPKSKDLTIGYIPDEWDEAYDAGKRKKIRSAKIVFGGSNPFQEIAMRKAKAKKGKLDKYSSANQPFRIQ
ncbi:OLC1v1035571C1 [Oldenlandia corymbosa var. corymbosa]|nr:OLC1v1035571C1 [Oldenlandia corymbosa var. corymbosa]